MKKLDIEYARSQKATMELYHIVDTALKNQCLSSAGLAIGTTSAKAVKIANTVTYLSDGAFKSKTTAEVAFTADVHDIPANADSVQEACYLITLAADGTPVITMGAIATGSGNAKLPERPATGTPIGYVRIAIAAGATKFDAGGDDLSAAHITDTYVNLGYLAPRFDAEL